MEDLREQLFNCGGQGLIEEVLVPADQITHLRGILFDLNPSVFRSGALLTEVPDDPAEFYTQVCEPMLSRHPLLAKAEVRISGTGVHAILWFDEPVALPEPGNRQRWAGIVQVVQTALPIDSTLPGITATTRPLGSTNSKNGATVSQLTPGTPVTDIDVRRFYRELIARPFRTVSNILLGDETVAPCPLCGQEGTVLTAGDQVGKCSSRCGQIGWSRLYDLLLAPVESEAEEDRCAYSSDRTSRGNALVTRMQQGQNQVERSPMEGSRRLPVLCGVTSSGKFIKPMEDVLPDARSLLVESARVYRYGNSIVMEGWDIDRKCLITLATDGILKSAVSAHLSNVFTCRAANCPRKRGEEFAPSRKLIELLFNDELTLRALPKIESYMQRPIFDEQFQFRGNGWHPDVGILIHAPNVTPVVDYEVPNDGPALDRLPPNLRRLLADFPFRSDADLANTIGVLLTAMMPPLFRNVGKPLVLVDGNRPGVGKTLLGLTIGTVMDYVTPYVLHYTANDEELGKRICAAIREKNQSVLLIDNAKTLANSCVSSATIEANSMAPTISLRILGQSRTFTRPNDVVWMITMNCTRVSQDLVSRGLPIRLEREGPPGEHDFGGRDPIAFALEHRAEILGELAGMVMRWVQAGRPTFGHDHRCARWAEVIGGILATCGLPEFLGNLKEAAGAFDAASDELQTLVEAAIQTKSPAVHIVANGEAPDGDLSGLTPPGNVGLPASGLEPLCCNAGALSEQVAVCTTPRARATAIGNFLTANVGRQFDIAVDGRNGVARLAAREGRSRTKYYCFLVRWNDGPDCQEPEEGPPPDAYMPSPHGNGHGGNGQAPVNLADPPPQGSPDRFTDPKSFEDNELIAVGEPGEPGEPPLALTQPEPENPLCQANGTDLEDRDEAEPFEHVGQHQAREPAQVE